MAGTFACRIPCQNPLPVKHVNNELAKQALGALVDSSSSRASITIAFCAYCLFHSSL